MFKKFLITALVCFTASFAQADRSTMERLNGLQEIDIVSAIGYAAIDYNDDLVDLIGVHLETITAGSFYDSERSLATVELDCSYIGADVYSCILLLHDIDLNEGEIFNTVVIEADVVEVDQNIFEASIVMAR